jgi:SAM-dependent methyltransferase
VSLLFGNGSRRGARINCPLCGVFLSDASDPIITGLGSTYSRGKEYSLIECKCGSLVTSPFPTKSLLDSIYAESYAYGLHLLTSKEKRLRSRNLLVNVLGSAKSICDLGCGDGSLLLEARNMGFVVTGCELDGGSVGAANSVLGAKSVYHGSIEQYLEQVELLPELVVMSHSLEHLLHPGDVLRKIHELLPEKGRLVIAVPNADIGIRGVLRRKWGYWQVPVHTTHFGARKFPRFLEGIGFNLKNTRFRSFDLLTLGSTILNILNVKSVGFSSTPSKILRVLLPASAVFWNLFMGLGKSEVIFVAEKK